MRENSMADVDEQRGKRDSMEIERLGGGQQPLQSHRHQHQVMMMSSSSSSSTRSALFGVVAAAVVIGGGGPLLGMMGLCSLMASLGLLILTSPLLTPLFIFAAFLLGLVIFMFALTTAMALTGFSTFSWMFRELRRLGGRGGGSIKNTSDDDASVGHLRFDSDKEERSSITESGERVKDEGEKKRGECVQHTAHVTSPPRDQNENEKDKEKDDKTTAADESKAKVKKSDKKSK